MTESAAATGAAHEEAQDKKEGVLDRLQSWFAGLQEKWPPLAHLVRAVERYQDRKADFFAAGVTYYSVLSLFPLIMIGFAILGQVLIQNPEMLDHIKDRITSTAQGGLAKQLNQLIDAAIASRGTVGTVGLGLGLWSGLGWIAAIRESLTQLWQQEEDDKNWFATKFSDLFALLSFGLALVVVFGLITLSKSSWLSKAIGRVGLGDWSGAQSVVTIASTVLATLAAWVLFSFVISRLPRKAVALRDAFEAGLIGAVLFEIFLELAWLLLKGVTNGPAGKTFGPILGFMVFLFFTARILLFSTAWAATERGAEARSAQLEEASRARAGAATGWLAGTFGLADEDQGEESEGGESEGGGPGKDAHTGR
ncbi:ribonuclease BN [Segniliparus rotundus DSM 44985]|uniref:Ribonuclease BN n=1 Tax=Segniliparus rotundus (strain ATCC BAA-972 / CDC 1076 / CIP 108378 / DSM 44985 / JCM 13578) TaxID=640132 RepID=D6ZD24_SEGRD|nr:YhjD/YihY/BrkB family envelope integrity protein [Segniliparus rotundus]ADG99211.1 ribonuclease BN [Segniliparus rotundus DSM 44985]